jgi:hypothetical protein
VDLRRMLIVDTGPIWEIVLYRAVTELGFTGLSRNLTHFLSPEAYENCGSFLSAFGKKTTSASVVAEIYRQVQKTEPRGHEQLWEQVYEEFERMGMAEDVVNLLDMDSDLVTHFGPTDVSLIEIARRNLDQKPVILTLDRRLHAECMRALVRSDLLIEVCNPG